LPAAARGGSGADMEKPPTQPPQGIYCPRCDRIVATVRREKCRSYCQQCGTLLENCNGD